MKYLDFNGLTYLWSKAITIFAKASHTHKRNQIEDFPSSLPANGGNSSTVNGYTVNSDVPAGAKFSDTVYTHPSYTSKASGLYKVTVDSTGHISAAAAVTKADITALGIPGQDTNTVYTHPTSSGNKHIPSGGASGQILRWSSDGTAAWGADNNTTYSNMTGATSSAAGKTGLVPAPAAGKQTSFLRGDGQWTVPPNTVYTHPSYTARSSGLYKVTVDSTGHISSVTAVSKADITALGIPGTDTKVTVDAALSTTSTNPVQNKIVKAGIDAVSVDVEKALDDVLGVGTVQALESLLG